jgi:hypothetical protein
MALSFEQTNLWKKYLANQANKDEDTNARERFRNAFLSFREKAAVLVCLWAKFIEICLITQFTIFLI